MFHQLSHEFFDPEEEEKNLEPAESIFYLTSSIFLSGMLMQALNVELLLSFVLISVYASMICFYVYQSPTLSFMFPHFLTCAGLAIPLFHFSNYASLISLQRGYEDQMKVNRLLIEQKNIIHHIPEGVLIYQELNNKD